MKDKNSEQVGTKMKKQKKGNDRKTHRRNMERDGRVTRMIKKKATKLQQFTHNLKHTHTHTHTHTTRFRKMNQNKSTKLLKYQI